MALLGPSGARTPTALAIPHAWQRGKANGRHRASFTLMKCIFKKKHLPTTINKKKWGNHSKSVFLLQLQIHQKIHISNFDSKSHILDGVFFRFVFGDQTSFAAPVGGLPQDRKIPGISITWQTKGFTFLEDSRNNLQDVYKYQMSIYIYIYI